MRQYCLFRTASCNIPFVVKSNAAVFPPIAAVVVARDPVLADADARRAVGDVLPGEVPGVALDEVETPPAEPDIVSHPSQPLFQVVPDPVLRVVDVGRGAVIFPRARVPLAAKLRVVRRHRALVPRHPPGEDIPPPGVVFRLRASVVDDDVRHGADPVVLQLGDAPLEVALRSVKRVQVVQIRRQVPLVGDRLRGRRQPHGAEPGVFYRARLARQHVEPVPRLAALPVEPLEHHLVARSHRRDGRGNRHVQRRRRRRQRLRLLLLLLLLLLLALLQRGRLERRHLDRVRHRQRRLVRPRDDSRGALVRPRRRRRRRRPVERRRRRQRVELVFGRDAERSVTHRVALGEHASHRRHARLQRRLRLHPRRLETVHLRGVRRGGALAFERDEMCRRRRHLRGGDAQLRAEHRGRVRGDGRAVRAVHALGAVRRRRGVGTLLGRRRGRCVPRKVLVSPRLVRHRGRRRVQLMVPRVRRGGQPVLVQARVDVVVVAAAAAAPRGVP
eukprot:29137-Pelagococcus_subviridis.AAC.3